MLGTSDRAMTMAALGVAFLFGATAAAQAQLTMGTAFTHQGRLQDGGNPANGDYDFQFELFDAQEPGGVSVAGPVEKKGPGGTIAVVDGLFATRLDFGSVYDGSLLFIETRVRLRDDTDTTSFTTLTPRQRLTPVAYALFSAKAADADRLGGAQAVDYAMQTDLAWENLANIPGDFADGIDHVNDADADPANELQNLQEVLTNGNDAGALDAVNLGRLAIGTATATESLLMEGGTFLQNSGMPAHVGGLDYPASGSDAAGIAVAGGYAYIADRGAGAVQVIDIADPASPAVMGQIVDNALLDLNGAAAIAVAGRYAYVAAEFESALTILDVSDPTAPVQVGSVQGNVLTPGLDSPTDLVVAGRFAYVCGFGGSGVIDISDPTNPLYVGGIADDGATALDRCESIAVAGRYAYIASLNDNGVEVLDISDPANPVHVGAIFDNASRALAGANSIAVAGRYAFVAASIDDGVEILDISDPSNPVHVAAIFDDGTTALDAPQSIALSGRYAFVTSGLDEGVQILDVGDPAAPAHIAAIYDNATRNLDFASGLAIVGQYAYVTSLTDGLEILKIPGIDVPAAHIGAIAAESLDTMQSATIGGDLHVTGGLDVGPAGLRVDGPMGVQGDAVLDRIGTGGQVRTLTLRGARQSTGFNVAALDFSNYDDNDGQFNYVGARIASRNGDGSDSGDLRFLTTEDGIDTPVLLRMIVTGEGKVGIGTDAPTLELHVVGDAGKTSGGSLWSVISDERAKRNIGPIRDAVETLVRLDPVHFQYNDTYKQSVGLTENRGHYGFLAQQYSEVFPEDVSFNEKAGYFQMNAEALQPHLVAAIKELRAELDARDRLIEELGKQNEAIMNRLDRIESALLP